ncbi:peflin [Nasonia vitripennis]|uniref:EF-hand domain-containing protein n=1 Tax=Nasonia vitripennis TaxID=7425 RepID=A0A7M7PZJ0_NASVI|nr:peflin [Nasonia vitripennis]XP_031778506.1 peflin [Nasonia vitripennis]XP_032452920.1 peflin [Nasonia vitripennis]
MAYPGQAYGSGDPSQINPQVQQWFALSDTDGSGRISSAELQKVLANGQGGTFSDKACRLMIGMFDKENKRSIDIVEFQALFNYINAWLGVFRGFDHDNSGSIQEEELAAAFTQMGYRFKPEFINFLIKRYDCSQQGSITVDQFIVLCVQIQKFTEEFRKRDTDMTGTINIEFEDFLGVALSTDV